jgi:acyl carrier protein
MSATDNEIRGRISTVSGIPLARLANDAKIGDLRLDSFSIVEMLVELQEEFKVRLDQQDVATVETIGDVIALVKSRISD